MKIKKFVYGLIIVVVDDDENANLVILAAMFAAVRENFEMYEYN